MHAGGGIASPGAYLDRHILWPPTLSAHAPLRAKRSLSSYVMPLVAALLLLGLLVLWLAKNFSTKGSAVLRTISFIGLTNGAVYALVALGYTLVYGILELINFAHGDVFMLGGMISGDDAHLAASSGSRRRRRRARSSPRSLGSLAVAMVACGADQRDDRVRRVPAAARRAATRAADHRDRHVVHPPERRDRAGRARATSRSRTCLPTRQRLLDRTASPTRGRSSSSCIVTVPVLLALMWLVQKTRQGKAMRATAQDRDAAAMMGINVNRTISFTFLIAGALAGAAGLLYALYFGQVRYDTGFQLGLIAFTAAVLGGIGNLPGRRARRALRSASSRRSTRGCTWHIAGQRLDAVDRLLDPHPHPRLPPRGAARRADAGRRLTCAGASRARSRARWWAALGAVGLPRERWHALAAADAPRRQGRRSGSRSCWSSSRSSASGRRRRSRSRRSIAAARRAALEPRDVRGGASASGSRRSRCSRSRSRIRTTSTTCRSCRSSGRSRSSRRSS